MYIIIDTRFSNDNSDIGLSDQLFDSKIWRKDPSYHKKDDSLITQKTKSDKKKIKESNLNNENNFVKDISNRKTFR